MGHKKAINNIHDRSYKDLYSHKEVFLDLVKEMLKAPWATNLDINNLVLVDKSYILSDYEENEAGIVYRANIDGKEVIFYTLLEFQSTVDYRMPLRLFFYINEILREYIKNLEKEDKKNKKGFNVPAVIPIVLYNATREWNAPRYFKDIVNKSELFGENIVNFKYALLKRCAHIKKARSATNIFSYIKRVRSTIKNLLITIRNLLSATKII